MAEVYSQQKKIDLDSPAQTRSFLLEKEGIICMSVTKESLKVNVSTGVKLSTPQASQIGSQSKASTSTVATEIREVDRWIALTDKGRFLIFGRKKGSLTVAERELEEAEQLKLTSDKKRSFIQTMKDKAKSRPIQELEPAESPKYEMIKMIDHQTLDLPELELISALLIDEKMEISDINEMLQIVRKDEKYRFKYLNVEDWVNKIEMMAFL